MLGLLTVWILTSGFSDQFKKIIKRYKRVGYNMDECDSFLFNSTIVGQASDSMTALT